MAVKELNNEEKYSNTYMKIRSITTIIRNTKQYSNPFFLTNCPMKVL